MAELKNDLEDNLIKMIQKNLQTLVPQTPAPTPKTQNQTILPSTIRQELKNIMKEVLSEKNLPTSSAISPLKTNAKCQLVSLYVFHNMKDNLMCNIFFNFLV